MSTSPEEYAHSLIVEATSQLFGKQYAWTEVPTLSTWPTGCKPTRYGQYWVAGTCDVTPGRILAAQVASCQRLAVGYSFAYQLELQLTCGIIMIRYGWNEPPS